MQSQTQMEMELRQRRGEEHGEQLAKNIFVITMLGAVGFLFACATVMF